MTREIAIASSATSSSIQLIRCHFEAMQNQPELTAFVKTLATDLTMTQGFKVIFLRTDGTFSDGTSANPFEMDLLTRWSTNSTPGAQTDEDQTERGSFLSSKYTYYRAVRAIPNCATCHRQLGSQPEEVIAVVKIELAR